MVKGNVQKRHHRFMAIPALRCSRIGCRQRWVPVQPQKRGAHRAGVARQDDPNPVHCFSSLQEPHPRILDETDQDRLPD